MITVYEVYVDGGEVIKDGKSYKLKKEFNKFKYKHEAEAYYSKLLKKFEHVHFETKKATRWLL